ncbi:1-acyl-sn-glycerol-3-phosphate acyltransferase [uncultured Corynebacterium sp.]|uniref:lysophospholipid acyltransferase family protein n=1 Tax=uncultured Corynebacterium sp. TaxID=159447 RepID=UPI0025F5FD18|nr:lysophospholipid acyltransferase family protein [uncultured Corynebacterium sp.]
MDIREGLIRVPDDLPRVDRHAEAGEHVYQGIIAVINRLLRWQGIEVTVFGAENVPQFGGALMAMNHTGYYDFIFGQIPAYIRGRRLTRFMAKKEIFDVPVVGWLMRTMQHVSVDRSAGAASIADAVLHLRSGRLVTIFPEATISRSFELKSFKNGAARIAHEAGVPLIPVVTWGSQRIWPKGGEKHLGKTGLPVYIRVGEPVALTGDADADIATLKSIMQAMLEELRADYTAKYGPFAEGLEWMPAALGGTAPSLDEANRMDVADREAKARAKAQKASRETAKRLRKADEKLAKRVDKAWRRLKKEH